MAAALLGAPWFKAAGEPSAPDRALVAAFSDTWWRYCERSCAHEVVYWRIHLRPDGQIGFKPFAGQAEMFYDYGHQWRIKGRRLQFSWTGGTATDEFIIADPAAPAFTGHHSRVDEPSVIERAPKE